MKPRSAGNNPEALSAPNARAHAEASRAEPESEGGYSEGAYASLRDEGESGEDKASLRETNAGQGTLKLPPRGTLGEKPSNPEAFPAPPVPSSSSTSVSSSLAASSLPPSASLSVRPVSVRPADPPATACSKSSARPPARVSRRRGDNPQSRRPSHAHAPPPPRGGRRRLRRDTDEARYIRLSREGSLARFSSSLRLGLLRSGLPVKIALESSEVASLQLPAPLFLFLPRSSYLPQIVSECVSRFRFFLRPTQSPGVPGPARAPSPCFSFLGSPLDWRLPLGVSFDLFTACQLSPAGPSSPWLGAQGDSLSRGARRQAADARDAGSEGAGGEPSGRSAGLANARGANGEGKGGRPRDLRTRQGTGRPSLRRNRGNSTETEAGELIAVCPPEACGASVPLPWPLTFHFHSSPATLSRPPIALPAARSLHGDAGERETRAGSESASASRPNASSASQSEQVKGGGGFVDRSEEEKGGGAAGHAAERGPTPSLLLPPAATPYEGWAAFESLFLNNLRQASYLLTGSAAAFHHLSKADELALLAAFRTADLAAYLEAVAPLEGGEPERRPGHPGPRARSRAARGWAPPVDGVGDWWREGRTKACRPDQGTVHRLPVRLHFVTRGVLGRRETESGDAARGAEEAEESGGEGRRWGRASTQTLGSKKQAVPLLMSMLTAVPVFSAAETEASARVHARGLAGSGGGDGKSDDGSGDGAAAGLCESDSGRLSSRSEGERKGGRETTHAEDRPRSQSTSETDPLPSGNSAPSKRDDIASAFPGSARRARSADSEAGAFYTLGDLLHSTLQQLFPRKTWRRVRTGAGRTRLDSGSVAATRRQAHDPPMEGRGDRTRVLAASLPSSRVGGREDEGQKRESAEEGWFSGSEEGDASDRSEDCDLSTASDDDWEDDSEGLSTEGEIVSVRPLYRSRGCRVLVQGVEPLLETPLYWLWKNASCMDLFLHVVVVLPPTVTPRLICDTPA
ncbi:putative autophagy protein [Neospora caninum Liverpool]|nr:putative autophagy protein [Neospora caninum Liverpool]CBZ53339.1 putative autophagy protein [Neospora caninum Liverpool]|eukprot:XP_003883371.1 putative autophagy protein [Neospora caninum Liverpool]